MAESDPDPECEPTDVVVVAANSYDVEFILNGMSVSYSNAYDSHTILLNGVVSVTIYDNPSLVTVAFTDSDIARSIRLRPTYNSGSSEAYHDINDALFAATYRIMDAYMIKLPRIQLIANLHANFRIIYRITMEGRLPLGVDYLLNIDQCDKDVFQRVVGFLANNIDGLTAIVLDDTPGCDRYTDDILDCIALLHVTTGKPISYKVNKYESSQLRDVIGANIKKHAIRITMLIPYMV